MTWLKSLVAAHTVTKLSFPHFLSCNIWIFFKKTKDDSIGPILSIDRLLEINYFMSANKTLSPAKRIDIKAKYRA